jgi:hypothetical protein
MAIKNFCDGWPLVNLTKRERSWKLGGNSQPIAGGAHHEDYCGGGVFDLSPYVRNPFCFPRG